MGTDLIGRSIGHYQLIKRLGAGGMASVYRALDAEHDEHVAIKVLPIHLAANDTLRQRFFREATNAARLDHPHILPIYDFGEDDGTPFIVMKLVDGGTLNAIMQEGLLPLRLVARVVAHVAQGLDYAHDQGVIHRDIKPQNILFDRQGQFYLGDFGIARFHETSTNLTGQGGFIGTAAYASPEQCRGEAITPASDIYSLGVVVFEMLTGELPFDGPTPLAIMHQHISEQAPNPLKFRPDLPLDAHEVTRKALAKLPGVRYQSAQAMSSALNRALRRELGTQPYTGSAPPLGPNPVFDKPPDAYSSPPPIPDELLVDLSPSRPAPPGAIASPGVIQPLAALPPDPAATPTAARVDASSILVVLIMVVVLASLVLALVLR